MLEMLTSGAFRVFAFLVTIGVLVFVHELGHFLVAKWGGVGVLRFSLGFGPILCSFRRRETVYQVCAIPLGGYVRMVGDMPDGITKDEVADSLADSGKAEQANAELLHPEVRQAIDDRKRWFSHKPIWLRSLIVVAGPAFNLFFAVFAFALSFLIYGKLVVENGPVLGNVMDGSPAYEAGLKLGDQVVTLNGKALETWVDFASAVNASEGEQLEVVVLRGTETLSLLVTPEEREVARSTGEKQKRYMVGVEQYSEKTSVSLFEAPILGTLHTGLIVKHVMQGLWGMISGSVSAKELAGPVFIFQAAGEHAKSGLKQLLGFMGVLSISLAILNLLPIPVLDGGHLLFFFLESVLGPLNMKVKEVAQQLGLVFLLGLMIFALHNDLSRESPVDTPNEKQTWAEEGEETTGADR